MAEQHKGEDMARVIAAALAALALASCGPSALEQELEAGREDFQRCLDQALNLFEIEECSARRANEIESIARRHGVDLSQY